MDENNGELKGGKCEHPEDDERDGKVENAEPISQSNGGKTESVEWISKSRDAKDEKAENKKAKYRPKRKTNFKKSKRSGVAKLGGRLKSFGTTVKKLWNVWGAFKTKNTPDPHSSISERTLGVPGFEEIACIEAEVPDIMMMDKDRVRTSCKECMRDPPTFPTKEQIKAKLIAADKYYDVNSGKTKREQSDNTLEHEADYHDVDGTVVRPSWRFILERPLVEQYVLMTNYIRKVSVLSELKEDKTPKKYIEEEDSGSDTEYKKFEQKFIKEKRELLKPLRKPKTQEMAVQTSFEPEQHSGEDLKESVSEISLYPESEDSTDSPEASAVTIVTSRDYTSPLQSDLDGRTTERSTSVRGGNWWESPGCQQSDSYQTSYDSINKNTSSGSDGQSIPIRSTWGKTTFQPAQGAFSNESDSQIIPHSQSIEPATHRKPKYSKKVSFSPVVTYYQGPNKNAAVYKLPDDEDTMTETKTDEQQQQEMETGNPPQNQVTVNPRENQIEAHSENDITGNPSKDKINDENPINQEDLTNGIAADRPNPSNRKMKLENVLQDNKPGQLVSVSLPTDWNENRILHNKQMVNVVVSRPTAVNRPVTKKTTFQEFDELPDVDYSDPQISTVQERIDANIQTQTPVRQKNAPAEKCKLIKHKEIPRLKQSFDYQNSPNPKQSKIKMKPDDDNPSTEETKYFRTPVSPHILKPKTPTAELILSERHGYDRRESIGTETNIQSAPPRLVSARPRSRTAEQEIDDRRTVPVTPDIPNASNTAVQQVNYPNTNTQTSWIFTQAPPREKNSYQPPMKDTGDTYPSNKNDVHHHSSANPEQKPVNQIPRISYRQHHQGPSSTDTEGPSSSSNEHIKLKASPACFFKVATPTDLSKISVDEFYPDVPEIDAELSQISETKTPSAPCVEIVFTTKETALRCMQDSEFRRVTRKDENIILQRSINTTGNDCQMQMNAPNKGKTIIASAGVGMKIDEGNFDTPKDKGQSKSSNMVASKAATKNSSQQSSITQCLRKIGLTDDQSLRGSEEEPIIVKETLAPICKADLGIREMKRITTQDDKGSHTVNIEETKPTNTKMAENTNQKSTPPVLDTVQNGIDKASRKSRNGSTVVSAEPKPIGATLPNKSVSLDGSSTEVEETPPCEITVKPPSYKEEVNDMTIIDKEQGEIEKSGRVEKLDQRTNYEEDETIQRQTESLSIDPGAQAINHGRTKLYMRTLSSLVEETSSVVESTSSSAQEKLIDMPAMVRSVEELKTIFEKKLDASMSGESEMQVEQSRSDPKKSTGLSKEKLEDDRAPRKLVSVEMITPTDYANKTTCTNHLQYNTNEKSSTPSQKERPDIKGEQNFIPAVVKLNDSNVKDMMHSKSCTAEDEKPVKAENGKNKHPLNIQEEPSVPQLSQIDIIRASEIYSNTSMYVSSSEDRVAKLSKTRTVFQPMTINDDLVSSACSRDRSNERPPGSSQNLGSKEKLPGMPNSESHINNYSKPQEKRLKLETNHNGDNFSVGQGSQQTLAETKQTLRKEQGETDEPTTNAQEISSGSRTHSIIENLQRDINQPNDSITIAKYRTDDTSNPSETKHWLLDVIPILSNARFRGFKPHKPICVKEATEAEAVKYRQEAVKPVFRFLKRQREMEENKE